MAFALNALALILVLGLCWAAMMWLSGRYHGRHHADAFGGLEPDFERVEPGAAPPCSMCEGVGASHRLGRLQPCPQCEGTGVLSYRPR